MEPIYRAQFYVSVSDCDCFGRLKPSAILAMIQQAATSQCMMLDMGWEDMAKKNLFWAVIRQKVLVTRLPRHEEHITLETWPGTASRVAYPRSTIAYDSQGRELFRSISLWVLMDLKTRTMILPGDSGLSLPEYVRGNELSLPKSLRLRNLNGHANRTVMYSELDLNCHMNNARYLDWVTDLLPSFFHKEHPIREFTINYSSEAKESEEIDLRYELTPEGQFMVEGCRRQTQNSTDHTHVFAVQASYV